MPRRSSKSRDESAPGYWLWVARPAAYFDEDGEERRDLDPDSGETPWGWWTCHRNTRRGDLILLWRTRPKSDIAYLIQAKTDAYSIAEETEVGGWQYGCDYYPIYKFQVPLAISEIRDDPYLDEWNALRSRFQKLAFSISPEIWAHLMDELSAKNKGFSRVLRRFQQSNPIPKEVLLEEDLENHLVEHLEVLRPHGFNLKLVGRQVVCSGHGGRIDLLCKDLDNNRYVVIELKNVRAGQNTIGQIMTYLGWVNEHHPKRKSPIGLVIARGVDNRYLSAASMTPHVQHLTLEQLGYV